MITLQAKDGATIVKTRSFKTGSAARNWWMAQMNAGFYVRQV